MIPSYLVYCAYGLCDTYWALILPGLISPFNMIIIKKFFQELPQELEDALPMWTAVEIFWTFVKIHASPVKACDCFYFFILRSGLLE